MSDYSLLFEPLQLSSGMKLPNRIVMAPMTNYSANADDTVSEAELAYYARRSGGIGMVITACTYVTANGKGFSGQFAGHEDSMIPSLRKLAETIQAEGAKAVLQIYHGGRACPPELVQNDVVSASAVGMDRADRALPRALEEDEIHVIIRAYGETTRRAIEAGYDGVEIHGANGYLLQQFFSPHTNLREDRWGGTLEKRMAFPLAVIEEVKSVVAKHADRPFLVGYRFSPEEPETPGITMDQTLAFVDTLAGQGLDYLHVSLTEFDSLPRRGADADKTRLQWIVETVRGRTPVIGVGSIHTPDEALKALETGIALVALGRELIMEPDWAKKTAAGKIQEIKTTLSRDDQNRLVIPDPLWHMVTTVPGWFPIE